MPNDEINKINEERDRPTTWLSKAWEFDTFNSSTQIQRHAHVRTHLQDRSSFITVLGCLSCLTTSAFHLMHQTCQRLPEIDENAYEFRGKKISLRLILPAWRGKWMNDKQSDLKFFTSSEWVMLKLLPQRLFFPVSRGIIAYENTN